MGAILDGIFWIAIIRVGIFWLGIVQVGVTLGGNCAGGSYPGSEFSLLEVFRVGIVRGRIIRAEIFWVGIFLVLCEVAKYCGSKIN